MRAALVLVAGCRFGFSPVPDAQRPDAAPCPLAFEAGPRPATGAAPRAIAAGDFNGDRNIDLAVADGTDGTVSILLGNGDGTFRDRVPYPAGTHPWSIAAGDLTRDGLADIVVGSYDDNLIGVYVANRDGSFRAPVTYPAITPQSIAIDRDNIVVSEFSNLSIELFSNTDGALAPNGRYATTAGPYQAVFTGDDVAVAEQPSSVDIFTSTGSGNFSQAQPYAVAMQPWSIAAGDLNEDGVRDLVVANNYSDRSISVLLGNSDGTFRARVDYPVGNFPWWVEVADLDRDGHRDVIVAGGADGFASVLLGRGDGTLQPRQDYPAGYALSLAVADFDNDGRLDVALPDQPTNAVTILRGACR